MRQEDPVGMVVVSSDGTRAATVSGSGRRSALPSLDAGSVTVWNLADGRRSVIENLGGRGGIVEFILPSGTNLLGVGYEYGSVVFHDVSTAAVRSEVKFDRRCCLARVALSTDNRMIAVAFADGGDTGSEVRIVDLDTGRERLAVTAPGTKRHHVQDIAFSPDGRAVALATWSSDQPPVTCVWDVGTGRQRFALSADQTGSATLLTFAPDGRMLATGGADGGVRLWETTTGVLRNLLGHHHAQVWALGFSADGRTLATAGEDGTMRLWDARTPADTVPTPQRFVDVEAMAFSRDGKRVATGTADGVLAVYATGSVTLLRSVQAHATAIESIAFSSDGALLASSARDGTITVRDASTFAERAAFRGQASGDAALSFDGASILYFGRDRESGPGRIQEWALSSRGSARWSDKATIVAVSADGRRIATIGGYEDGSGHCELKVRTRGDIVGRVMTRCKDASTHFTDAALSPDGRYLAVGGPDLPLSGASDASRSISGVLIYDLESSRPPVHLALEVRHTYEALLADVVFSPDGRLLATASVADRVKGQDARGVAINVWSVPDGRHVKTFVQPDDDVCRGSHGAVCARTLRFSPDARALHFLRGGGNETELVRLDLAGGERRARLVRSSRIGVMEFFAEGMFATMTAHGDAPVLWDAVRVQPIRAVGERRATMADVAFHDDGVVAATIESDNILDPTVRFWNITKGEPLRLPATAPVAADRVTFSADGRFVALERQDHLAIRELDGWRQLAAVDGLTRIGQFTWSIGRPAFALDGRLVAVSTSTSVVLQSTSGESPGRLPGKTVAALSPDGTRIAINDCPELHVLDVPSGRPRAQLHSEKFCVRRAAFSPDGTTIVTIAGQARLWRADNGREVVELEGFSAEDAAVAFSPDGKTLATGGANANVDLWNPQNGRRLLTLTAGAPITALAFSSDGATLAAVTPTHVRLWRAALTVSPQVQAAGTR
jgi:WD40 repeat protein